MSQFIDDLKAQSGDLRSTRELTLVFGQQVEQRGRQDVFAANPDFAEEYASLKDEIARLNRPSYGKEFAGSLGAAVDSAQAGGLGLLKLGADAVGADRVSGYLGEQVAEQNRQAAEYQPSVPSYRDVHGVDDAARYALYGAGQVLPSLAVGAATGAAGGLAARGLAGLGMAELGTGASEAAIAARAARLAAATQTGTNIGLGASSVGQEVGSIYNDTGDAAASLGFGTAAGLLDVLPEAYVVGKFFKSAERIGPEAAKEAVGYWRRFAGEVAKVVPLEGTTEAAQTLLEISAGKYSRGESPEFTADDYRQALNAGAIGAIGGAMMAPVAAIPGHGDQAARGVPPGTEPPPAAATPAPAPIPTDGLPPDVVAAVQSAEAAAAAIAPPTPVAASPLREAADSAMQSSESPYGAQMEGDLQRLRTTGTTAVPGAAPDLGAAPVAEVVPKVLDPQIKITVVAANGDQAGYVNIDKDADGGAYTPEGLRSFGYEIPDLSQLPPGEYTIEQALAQQAEPSTEPKIAVPTVDNLMPVPEPEPADLAGFTQKQIDDLNAWRAKNDLAPLRPTEESEKAVYKTGHDAVSRENRGREYTPAIRLFDGTVIAENGHAEAYNEAAKRGVSTAGSQRGFATRDGEFLTLLEIGRREMAKKNSVDVESAPTEPPASPLTLESATLDEQAKEAAGARETAAASAQRTEIEERAAAPLTGDSSDVAQGQLLAQDENLFSGKSAETLSAEQEAAAEAEANALPPPPADLENTLPVPQGRTARDMVRMSSRIRQIDKDLLKARGDSRKALLIERLQVGAEMGHAESARALEALVASDGQPDSRQIIRDVVKKMGGITSDKNHVLAGEIRDLKQNGVPKRLINPNGKEPDAIGEGIRGALEAHGLMNADQPALTESEALELVRDAFREQQPTEPPRLVVPLVKKESELYTQRVSADSLTPSVSGARLYDSALRALTEDRGIPVKQFEDSIDQAVDSAIKTEGATITTATGQKIVALATDSVRGPLSPQATISLLHEVGHVFTDGLPEPLRVAAQQAIDELPFTQQRWLQNPEALDARLLATADPATLSAKQLDALAQMTPQEIAAARALPPEVLVRERMAEHLAQLGWDKQQAVTFVDRLFRFVKDLWLKTALAIQTALKGEDQTNPELARQFVENRFLQFINRDAAYASDRINDLRNWIGIPQTTRERQPNFPGGTDTEMRMQFADSATGTLIPISYGTYTPDSLRSYLQRSLDNAARAVREKPPGAQSPDQIQYTKRVNFQKPLPLEPEAAFNVQIGSVNIEDEIYQRIRNGRNIAGLLPRTNGQPMDHAAFLSDWMNLPAEQHPGAMKDAILAQAKDSIDPTTNQPVAHNPDITIGQLPGYTETQVGKEKVPVQVFLSEQQDEALALTIFSLRDTEIRMQRAQMRDSERLNDLIGQRDKQKSDFPASARKELDELQRTTLLRAEIIKELSPQISQLEAKFDPRRSTAIYPTAEYPRVPSPTATEEEILSNKRGVVPRSLDYSSDAAKSALGQDLADFQAWLAVPENRQKGAIYGTIDEVYRKLMQVPTRLKRVHTTVALRGAVTNGLARETNLTGLPGVVAFGRKLNTVSRVANENRVQAEKLGANWESAYVALAKALGRPVDQSFRESFWTPISRIWNRVDPSRTAELETPAKASGVIDRITRGLNEIAGLEIKTPPQREALRDLMLATIDAERWQRSVAAQNDVAVHDEELGFDRRLIPRGIIAGRRTLAHHMTGLFARMNESWTDTSAKPFWDHIEDLYSEDRPAYDAAIKKLFTSYVVKDFVEPWATDTDPVFDAPAAGDSVPRMAAPNRVREAWRAAKGDVTKFAELLHAAEGGEPGAEAKTVASVLRTLRNKFYEQKHAVDGQIGAQRIGTEIIPRQLMDARVAHNWPADHISYATYGTTDNALVLNQLALGAAFGRDAIGANSEMHMTFTEAKRDVAQLWREHEQLFQQGKTLGQIEQIMGRDDAKIARNHRKLAENIDNIEKAFVGMTTHSGYLLSDFKAMNAAVNLFATMMIQNPRSGFGNIISDIQGSLAALKFSSQGLRAFRDSTASVGRDMATAIVRAFGMDFKFNTDLSRELNLAGAIESETASTWRQRQHLGTGTSLTAPVGYEGKLARIGRSIVRGSTIARDVAANIGSPFQVKAKPGDQQATVAPKLRAGVFGTTAISTMLGNNRAGYNAFAEMALRGVQYIESLPDSIRDAVVRELELGTKTLDARQLGYNRGWLLNDEAAFDYLKNSIETQFTGDTSSVGRLAAKAFRRKQSAGGGPWAILSNGEFSDIVNVTNSYWTLQNNFATGPHWMQGALRPLFTFLTWPYQAMQKFGGTFADPQGRVTNSTIADGAKTFFLLAAPATIAGSFAIDLYDKYALGKKQNLREASLATALPGVGVLIDPHAFMERIGRYGSAGFATDIMNRIVNYDTQRNMSLDDRIVAVSSIESLLNAVAVEPFQTGGNITYSSTVRPFLQAIGGGGVLQYLQVMNNLLGLNNQEAAINARINTSNYLRAAGRELELPVRVMSGPSEAPTPTSPYLRQMELAATVDNPELFRAAYQNAIQAARQAGHEDAERYVAQNFADRHPLRRVFRSVPTEGEYRNMLGLMGDLGSKQVRDAVNSYNRYLSTYFNRQPFYGRVDKDQSVDDIIRQASRLTPSLNYQLAAP